MTKRSTQRHFPYQHPTFGTSKKPRSEDSWKRTIYYLWWAYLRHNSEYIECCASGGRGPMSSLYEDFGDVRDESFKDWWMTGDRAIRLFAEPIANDSVRVLSEGESVPSSIEGLTVFVPLTFPKSFLQRKFREILAKHHNQKRGYQYAKASRAKYQFEGQPNIPALTLALIVYEYRLAYPKKKLWEIGNEIANVLKDQKIRKTDDRPTVTYKKRVLAIAVKRYLKRAEESIRRVGLGLSP